MSMRTSMSMNAYMVVYVRLVSTSTTTANPQMVFYGALHMNQTEMEMKWNDGGWRMGMETER